MNTHTRCPTCDTEGMRVQAQDGETLVCPTEGCRVFTFARYYG